MDGQQGHAEPARPRTSSPRRSRRPLRPASRCGRARDSRPRQRLLVQRRGDQAVECARRASRARPRAPLPPPTVRPPRRRRRARRPRRRARPPAGRRAIPERAGRSGARAPRRAVTDPNTDEVGLRASRRGERLEHDLRPDSGRIAQRQREARTCHARRISGLGYGSAGRGPRAAGSRDTAAPSRVRAPRPARCAACPRTSGTGAGRRRGGPAGCRAGSACGAPRSCVRSTCSRRSAVSIAGSTAPASS